MGKQMLLSHVNRDHAMLSLMAPMPESFPLAAKTEDEHGELEFVAEMLHSCFCMDEDCGWDEHEDISMNPWVYPSHYKWFRLAEKLDEHGVALSYVLENLDKINGSINPDT